MKQPVSIYFYNKRVSNGKQKNQEIWIAVGSGFLSHHYNKNFHFQYRIVV